MNKIGKYEGLAALCESELRKADEHLRCAKAEALKFSLFFSEKIDDVSKEVPVLLEQAKTLRFLAGRIEDEQSKEGTK